MVVVAFRHKKTRDQMHLSGCLKLDSKWFIHQNSHVLSVFAAAVCVVPPRLLWSNNISVFHRFLRLSGQENEGHALVCAFSLRFAASIEKKKFSTHLLVECLSASSSFAR